MTLCSEAFSVLHSILGERATRGGLVGVQISMHPGHLDEQHMWWFFSWMNFIVLVFLIVLSLGPDPWVLLLNHSHTWWCYGTFLTWLWRWIKENVILRLFRHCLCIFSSQWFLGTQGPIKLSRKYSFCLCDPCMKMMCPKTLMGSFFPRSTSFWSSHFVEWTSSCSYSVWDQKEEKQCKHLRFLLQVTRCLGVTQSAQVLTYRNVRAEPFCNSLRHFDIMAVVSFNTCNIIFTFRWWTVARKGFTPQLCRSVSPTCPPTASAPRRRRSSPSSTRRAASARRSWSWPIWPRKTRGRWRHPGASPSRRGG